MNKTATVTPEKMQRLAEEIGDVREVIDLVTDLINFIPNVKSEQVQSNPLFLLWESKGITKQCVSCKPRANKKTR